MENHLNIISADSNSKNPIQKMPHKRQERRLEAQARFDRLWLVAPETFDPYRNVMERERLARTLTLIEQLTSLQDKKVADLGCGMGAIARVLRDKGAQIDAVDISGNALKILSSHDMTHIQPMQDYVPLTSLKDDAYDLVVCTELIGYLPRDEHRLLFSELARLVKPDGYVVCSTALDIDSEDPLQQFVDLTETELKIEKWKLSYHRCWIRLKNFFSAPSHYARAWRDPEYRRREEEERQGFSRRWFHFNSRPALAAFWSLIQYLCYPLVTLLKNNQSVLLRLEGFCHFFWSDAGISHAILIGKRKPLFMPPPEEPPREMKGKRQVWE